MPDIGFLPTKTTVNVREPDGDAGTIPAATPSAAGVMTAEQAKRLDALWQAFQALGGESAPVVIERSADMSQYPTRLEVKALVQQLPRALDVTPQITALRSQVESLMGQVSGEGRVALAAPDAPAAVADTVARSVLDGVITQFEALDARVRQVETVIESLKQIAVLKSQAA